MQLTLKKTLRILNLQSKKTKGKRLLHG